MMIYQQDSFKLTLERVSDETHPIFGDMTIFHDVVIASEIVQEYNDGLALKTRDELEAYAWTADGRWIIAGSHPSDGIISERDQVAGRTINARYVKDLKDPKTERPTRAGVRADIQVFNDKISPELLNDMKNGLKPDVSIGFFFSKDQTSGIVEDGTLKGASFDYVQRNMFHDHLAVAIDAGRCPSPLCGLGADEVKKQVTGDPLMELLKDVTTKNPELSIEHATLLGESLKAKHIDKLVEDDDLVNAGKRLRLLLEEEYESLRGERDALKETKEWWMTLDWQNDEKLAAVFPHLTEDIRNQITTAGLCPTCGKTDEEEECEEGYHMVEGECVEDKKEEDVLESNPGFAPGKAEEECPEGLEWNAEKKTCVEIANFGGKNDAKPTAREVLDRFDRIVKS